MDERSTLFFRIPLRDRYPHSQILYDDDHGQPKPSLNDSNKNRNSRPQVLHNRSLRGSLTFCLLITGR